MNQKPSFKPHAKPAFDIRRAACEVLRDTLAGRGGEDAMANALQAHAKAEARDRAFMHLLVRTALRHLGQIDKILQRFIAKPLPENTEFVQCALRIGTAQLLWLKTPPHAAVNEMVELLKNSRYKGFSGMANAVLKKVAVEGEQLLAGTDAQKDNVPVWWWERWVSAWGEENTRRIIGASQQEIPLDLQFKDTEIAKKWAQENHGIALPFEGAVRVHEAGAVPQLAGFSEGEWWVQDIAASIPVRLLKDVKNKTVLDLCAAPGGKTLQLAAAGANVIAVDKSFPRLKRLKENLNRTKMQQAVKVIQADLLEWQPKDKVDAILLDAPCSATGTLRRHPDAPWRKQEGDSDVLAGLQQTFLSRAAEWLKPGGVLIYCVCSLEPEEGELQVAQFLSSHKHMRRSAVKPDELANEESWLTDEGDVRLFPYDWEVQGGMDGFYIARFAREE